MKRGSLALVFSSIIGFSALFSPVFSAAQTGGDQIVDGIGETALIARYVFDGNLEDRGRNHLHAALLAGRPTYAEEGTFGKVLSLPGGDPDNQGDPGRIAAVRAQLLAHRNTRPRPPRDHKILTDWNALMIAALATASRIFEEPAYGQMAERAMRFILRALKSPDGGLLHRW